MNEKFSIEFSTEKNEQLKQNRNICFDDIIPILEEGAWLDIVEHPNPDKYPDQSVFVLEIDEECYALPFVVDEKRKTIFLKTLFPSRQLRKIYLKGVKK
jgi:hypothetical protein